jgi:hypothetical protein
MGEWRHRSNCRRRQPLLQDGIGSLRPGAGLTSTAIPSPATLLRDALGLVLCGACALLTVAWLRVIL